MNQIILDSSAVSEGAWYEVDHLEVPYSVEVIGFASGDVAQVYVCNNWARPSTASPTAGDGTVAYTATLSQDTIVEVTAVYKWIRCIKSTAGGSPATTVATLVGRTKFSLPPLGGPAGGS